MDFKIKKNRTVMSIMLIAVFITGVFGQKQYFSISDYEQVGVHAAMDNYFPGGEAIGVPLDSPVTYQPNYFPSMSFGVNAFVLKRDKFNFKIGLRGSFLSYSYKMVIEKGQTPNNADDDIVDKLIHSSSFIKYGIPITGEYFIQTKKKRRLTIFTTLIPSYWKHDRYRVGSSDGYIYDEYTLPKTTNTFYFDVQIGLSYYIPTRYALVQPFVYYNKSFRDIWEDVPFQIRGIRDRPYTQFSGTTSQSGDHISFGFNLYIKKSKAYLKRQEERREKRKEKKLSKKKRSS